MWRFAVLTVLATGCTKAADSGNPPVETDTVVHTDSPDDTDSDSDSDSPIETDTPVETDTDTAAEPDTDGADDTDSDTDPLDTDVPDTDSDTDAPPDDTDAEPSHIVALIGDYGVNTLEEEDVAALIDSWNPDAVVTLGDNNYPYGEASTIDVNIGQYFHQYIGNYHGMYGAGSPENRFFPVLGNHDYYTAGAQPYLDYFTLPGNERYYTINVGSTQFFMVDSDPNEPDGVTADSVQGLWLKAQLAASPFRFQVVVFHHPAYSSGIHGDAAWMQWPFAEWGADIVFAGHEHLYERFSIGGIPYVTNGLGGRVRYTFNTPRTGSLLRFNSEAGALRMEVWDDRLLMQMMTTSGRIIDRFWLGAATPSRTSIVLPASDWRWSYGGTAPDASWLLPTYDDSAWAEGPGPLGYGDSGMATTLPYENPVQKPLTAYFRHHFTVRDPSAWEWLRVRLARDDGARVWINGEEVLRTNLPAGELTDQTRALADQNGYDETNVATAWVQAANVLTAGENVVTVEVHQSNPASEDLRFDLALDGE